MNSANKVLFLGDSGVGKSTLINTLCGHHNIRPQSTLGCSIQILPHQHQAGTPNESTELVELWDIGGSNAHREASRVFLDSASGVVFVHDLSNSRSEQNLANWLDWLQNHRRHGLSSTSRLLASPPTSIYSPPGQQERSTYASAANSFVALDVERVSTIPTLVVGTQLDQCPPKRAKEHANSPLLRQYEHISLDARRPIQPGSTNRLVFSSFFDAVIRHSADCLNRVGGTSSSPSLSAAYPRHRQKMP